MKWIQFLIILILNVSLVAGIIYRNTHIPVPVSKTVVIKQVSCNDVVAAEKRVRQRGWEACPLGWNGKMGLTNPDSMGRIIGFDCEQ